MRICYIVAPGEVGGLERVVHGLAHGFASRGEEVHVIAVEPPDQAARSPFRSMFNKSPAIVHALTVPAGVRHFQAERRLVGGLLRQLRPDVVHTHGYRSDLLDAGIARGLGIRTVTTIHGESFMGGRTALYEWLQWRAYRAFDAVVAVSNPLAATARARRVSARRLHVIPNAWPGGDPLLGRNEARRLLGLPDDGIAVGWLGRTIRVKGADVFLEALAIALPANARACIIGDGSERPALEELATRLGLGDRVIFAGAIPNGARLLRAFDTFVLSSRSEGTPIVLFEAMEAALPIVATAVGGVPDILDDGCAWLAPPESPEALASALQAALADPDRSRQRGEQARKRLHGRFDTDSWLDAHRAIYGRR